VVARLARLAVLVASWNRRMNLTGHRTAETVARRLVLDALALARVLPCFDELADLGSGAGFPGLPIAIRHPERQVTLVESRERRHHFQRSVLRELGLTNVRALRGRAEQLEPIPHAAVVAQAVADPLDWMLPWARPGGLLVLPSGDPPPPAPCHRAASAFELARYRVPLGGASRTAWIGRRLAD